VPASADGGDGDLCSRWKRIRNSIRPGLRFPQHGTGSGSRNEIKDQRTPTVAGETHGREDQGRNRKEAPSAHRPSAMAHRGVRRRSQVDHRVAVGHPGFSTGGLEGLP
jgi:hypothetical protein